MKCHCTSNFVGSSFLGKRYASDGTNGLARCLQRTAGNKRVDQQLGLSQVPETQVNSASKAEASSDVPANSVKLSSDRGTRKLFIANSLELWLNLVLEKNKGWRILLQIILQDEFTRKEDVMNNNTIPLK